MLVGYSIANIGLVYKNMGNFYAADTCFVIGKRMIENVQSESGVAMILVAMSTNYNEWGKYRKAIESAEEGLVIAQRIGAKKTQMDAYIEMSKGNASLKNFGKAYEYLLLGNALKDSIWKEEKQKQISELETKYESAKKEKEIVLLTKEKELQKTDLERQDALIAKRETQRNALVAGILLLFILAFVIYRGYRLKKKDNLLLAAQKEEIMTQKEEIESQRDEIFVQKHIIEEKNKSLTDSIRYAHRIQSALLPSRKALIECCSDFFILYKPRDIVSGDFYWAANKGNVQIIAVADCTGHGVPGALMSMLGITFLNEISRRPESYTAAGILEELRKDVIRSLQQKSEHYKREETGPADCNEVKVMDGMDIAICIVDRSAGTIQFAGANNGCLIVLPNGETKEMKPDKMPVGIYHGEQKPFLNQSVEVGKEFRLYLYTDGYADQFGGVQGKKYLYSKLRALLSGSVALSPGDQLKLIETELESWLDPASTGTRQYEQTDDITVLGLQFNDVL
jgi:serine phosphatase RsbU (regulator of sigma subunit)